MRMRNMIATGALVVASLLMVAPAAQAGGGGGGNGDVITRGSCSGQSDWKLKVKPDNSRLELEFEVDSNVNGQSWNVRIKQNGDRIFNGTRVTPGPERIVRPDPPSERHGGDRSVRGTCDEPVDGRDVRRPDLDLTFRLRPPPAGNSSP